MTRNVLVTVTGRQRSPENGDDTIEITAAGEYHFKNGRHFLIYEEAMDETDRLTKNLVKFVPGSLEVTKKGQTDTHMLFLDGQETLTHYVTPYGDMVMEFDTSKVAVEESPDRILVTAAYNMKINFEFAAECSITIRIVPAAL